MASTDKLKRVSPIELDALLDQAQSENWQQLVLVGPGVQLDDRLEKWPDSLKSARQIFVLNTIIEGLDSKLQLLRSLTSLVLQGNYIGDDGAKAIAASLPGLTSLDLSNNKIGEEGAQAIAVSMHGLTSLDLRRN